jgi:transcription initiation factor TFIIF subunit alpha
MEGGVDEELDYDVAEDFQDDDENNTFYHDQEEEEETKYQEVSQLIFVDTRS